MKDLMVSIDCITYNHENYLKNAIESFLMQKTNFEIEILIHDDASTDKTAEIIREYQKKYPKIIKPIFQKQNKYSLGINPSIYNISRAQGKYIAFCEGDDYWTDPLKLQKQVDFLENNPEFSLCGHNCDIFDNKLNHFFQHPFMSLGEEGELFLNDMISGVPFQFATMVTRTKLMQEALESNFIKKVKLGEYQQILILLQLGRVFRLEERMSVYNYNNIGSWTRRNDSYHAIIEINKYLDNLFEWYSVYYPKTRFYVGLAKEKIREIYKTPSFKFKKFIEYHPFKEKAITSNDMIIKSIEFYGEIYIFGAGKYGQRVAEYIEGSLTGFIDNNKALYEKKIMNKNVYELKNINKEAMIFICSLWAEEIEQQIIELGFENYFFITEY